MTETPERIRVLLVDDHEVVRRGLRGFLELQDDIEVVGEAPDGRLAVDAAASQRPDVILMDLLMPNMDGLTAITTIKQAQPEVEIVAVTSFIEEEKVTSALEAGASGYLLKDADAEEVASAVRAAHAGEVHLDPAVARLLAQRMRSRREAEPVEPLTAREKEVLAQADTDAELLGALASHAAIVQANARLYGEARAAAEQMEISERRYRHLVDHSPDLVWSVDAEGQFTYLGESLERMTGHRPDQLLGRHWSALTLPDSVHIATAGWEAIRERPDEEQQIRISLPLATGGTIPAEVNMIGTTVDGYFAGAHGSIRDIRERERLEEDLRRRSAELAANQERANLARELHDSVTQALFSMGLTLRALELLLDRDPVAARAKLTELRDLQKDALAEMRTLIFELRPRGLETDGLAQALHTHAAAVEGRTGLAVTVEVDSDEWLPLETEEALYRIAQEALHNVVKHANARMARIELRRSGRELRLTIDDDGIGFDPTTTPRGHLGLVGMRQRAERLNGSLAISRRPAGGTRVRVSLPLAQSAE